MTVQLRYATAAEFAAVADLDGASFGFQYGPQDLEDALLDVDPAGMLLALDGEQIVGVSAEVPLTMTLPGGSNLDVTGLTWVSVEITHRRRGLLRRLVERQLRTCRDNGVPALVLTASEGGIYGRYGFGVASRTRKTEIDRHRARLARPVADPAVRRVPTDAVRGLLPDRYDRWRRITPGAIARNEQRWTMQLLDREYQRGGMSGLFHLVHDDGYVSYRIRSDWNDGHPRHVCWIADYVISTPAAHAALWQVLLGMDLCAGIESYRIPLDDPLPYLLTDQRQVRTTVMNDGLWLRPLDVGALLSARTYALDVDAVVGVRDGQLGDGTYRLVGGPAGATCEPTNRAADVELDVADLGAVVLGGTRLAAADRAGRVLAGDPAVVRRLDRALLGDVEPQYGTAF